MAKKRKDSNKPGFLEGFKNFISKGSVVDLAIGVIIGAAFGAIVTSLVNDVIMPPIAALFGDKGFDQYYWVIKGLDPLDPLVLDGTAKVGAVMYYGKFIQTIVNFLIIAFVIYVVFVVVIKGAQKRADERKAELQAKNAPPVEPIVEPEPEIPADIQLLTEIRDQLTDLNKGK